MSIDINVSGEKKQIKTIYTNINGVNKQIKKVLYGTSEGIKYIYDHSTPIAYDYIYLNNNTLYCTNDFTTSTVALSNVGGIKGLLKKNNVYYCFCKSASSDVYTSIDVVYTSTDKIHWSLNNVTGIPKASSGSRSRDFAQPFYLVDGIFYFLERIDSIYYACSSEDGITWTSNTVPGAGVYSTYYPTLTAYGVTSVDSVAYFAMYSYRDRPKNATKSYEFTFGQYSGPNDVYDYTGGTGYKYSIDRGDINQLWLCIGNIYRAFTISNGTMTKASANTTSTTPNMRWCDNHLYGYSGSSVYKDGVVVATLTQDVNVFVARKEGGILVFDAVSNVYSLDENDTIELVGVAQNVPSGFIDCIAEEPEE